ncbi:MAG: class I SAM-dependent methyltransferase [Sediminibacterium sp.]
MTTTGINFDAIVKPMEGWCTPEKAQRLFNLVIESDSKISVELGVFGGRSLVPIGLGHKKKGSGFVIGIDAWNNKVCIEGTNDQANNDWWLSLDMKIIYASCQRHIELNELEGFCDTLRIRSTDVAILFPNESIDLLHQDSNHNAETIIAELKLWIPKVKIGGYWIADDTDWKEAKDGYSHLSDFGLELLETYTTEKGQWQVWKKVKNNLL